MNPTTQTDYAALMRDSFALATRSENLVPLLVDAILVLVAGVCTLGILLFPLAVGYNRMVLKAARGQPIAIGESFQGMQQFGASFVAGLLLMLAGLVSSCTVVGPFVVGFFATYVFILLAERPGMGAVDALKESVNLSMKYLVDTLVVTAIWYGLTLAGSAVAVGGIVAYAFSAVMTVLLYLRITAGTPGGSLGSGVQTPTASPFGPQM